MKQIQLTQGQIALVDDEDYGLVSQYKWWAAKNYDGTYHAVSKEKIGKKRVVLRMHRLIMGVKYGEKQVVHHKDHNTLNNTRDNLEICTYQQNSRHQVKLRTRKTSSEYKGVSWKKSHNKWQTHIGIGGKRKRLGYFTDEKEAAKAYNDAAIEHFGEYALLNEID